MQNMKAFDFDNALTMHRAWKMKFHLALGRVHGKDFDTQPLGDAAQCSLGQWLAANAAELAGSDAARQLLPIHEEFHRQSKTIADDIRNGKILVMTDPAIVAYLSRSEQIEDLLLQLKAELQSAA
jgi:hypothetical protein